MLPEMAGDRKCEIGSKPPSAVEDSCALSIVGYQDPPPDQVGFLYHGHLHLWAFGTTVPAPVLPKFIGICESRRLNASCERHWLTFRYRVAWRYRDHRNECGKRLASMFRA